MGIGNIFVVEIFSNTLSEKERNDLIQTVQTYNSKEKDMKDVLQGWPSNIVEWKGKVGVVIPFRDNNSTQLLVVYMESLSIIDYNNFLQTERDI